jgi:hypothetical protein
LATPLTYSIRRDDSDFVVFCFGKPERAAAFAKTLRWGEVANRQPAVTLKTSGRPERVVRDEREAQNVNSFRRTRPRDRVTKASDLDSK